MQHIFVSQTRFYQALKRHFMAQGGHTGNGGGVNEKAKTASAADHIFKQRTELKDLVDKISEIENLFSKNEI